MPDNHPAPSTGTQTPPVGTATTEAPKAIPQSSDITVNATQMAFWVGLLLAFLTIGGVVNGWVSSRRKEAKTEADARAAMILRTIEEKQEDVGRELKAVERQIEHNNNGSKARDQALQHQQEKMENSRIADYTRIIQLEGTIVHLQTSMSETKTMVRETRDEMNRKLDVLMDLARKP